MKGFQKAATATNPFAVPSESYKARTAIAAAANTWQDECKATQEVRRAREREALTIDAIRAFPLGGYCIREGVVQALRWRPQDNTPMPYIDCDSLFNATHTGPSDRLIRQKGYRDAGKSSPVAVERINERITAYNAEAAKLGLIQL
jgi:hypothetical protein